MPWDEEISALKKSLEPKDAATQLDEIIHGTRFTALFTKAEYAAGCSVLWELTMLRKFKNSVAASLDKFAEEGEKI